METETEEEINVLGKYKSLLKGFDPMRPMGKVLHVRGNSIITEGPPEASVGDLCRVEIRNGESLMTEIVGFQGYNLVQIPHGPTSGVSPGSAVRALGKQMTIQVGEELLGRILDGMGRPLDKRPPVISGENRNAINDPPHSLDRPPIRRPVETGIRAIDSMLTLGAGQRIGIFAGTGVGKSTLLGMIARYTQADINVICLVGERSREVREFLEHDLGEEALEKSVVFVATSDRNSMEKVYAANFATSAAEYFRDQGLHVNLYMDSITRYCMALRDIGISSGEQLGPGGYPPGVWRRLSELLERAGTAPGGGSITGLYTVLVEADDMNDPVADNARGILDGHIILSRRLAHKGHYPAIEIQESISRVMDRVISAEHKEAADKMKRLLAAYAENEELINLQAYPRGSNRDVDEYLEKETLINQFFRQKVEESTRLENSAAQLQALMHERVEEDYY